MEHTGISQFGYILGFLAFIFSLLSAVSYFFSTKNEGNQLVENNWRKLGRISYLGHALSIFMIVGLLFFLLLNHYYEFNYIWKYSNNSMPGEYVFASFWGGQEGSFLIWIFWNALIGLIVMLKARKWESSVMAVYSLIQVFMSSMILGVYVLDLKIGSSPFVLIRMLPENIGLPWTEMSDYMSKIPMFRDGQGLNPSLRNYWMTIHPPTLFLGFALTAVPFSYAIAGLWRKKITEWIKPALPWTFIGVGVLGLGILMGGAWAYESLTFGGFWIWDPVENVSYIPWLVFVGAGHLMLVNKTKPISIFLTFVLTFLSFLLVLYSTFLTRSGVLGDASVHSFTDNGMLGQLLLSILFFVWLSVFALLKKGQTRIMFTSLSVFMLAMGFLANYKEQVLGISPGGILFILGLAVMLFYLIVAYLTRFREKGQEEALWSREFWMFLGSLVLFLACMEIFVDNSFPVWNKLFNMDLGKKENQIMHYNLWQGAFAVFVALFVGFSQFLKYKKTNPRELWRKISRSLFITIALTALAFVFIQFPSAKFSIIEQIVFSSLLFASIYAVIGNLDYYLGLMKGKFNAAGSSIAHIGFGLILFAALVSNSQGEPLTNNKKGKFDLASLSEDFNNNADAQIFLGDTVDVNEYFASFNKRYQEDIHVYYEMDYFEKVLNENNEYVAGKKLFSLNPRIQLNEKFGNAPEPSTKHYADHDVFTYIKYPNPSMFKGQNDGYMPYEKYELNLGDTVNSGAGSIIAENFEVHPYLENDKAGIATFKLNDYKGERSQKIDLIFMIKGDSSLIPAPPEILADFDAKIGLSAVSPPIYQGDSLVQKARFELILAEKEYIIMHAKTFPLINILWIGIIIMFLGSIMAALNRFRGKTKSK